MNADGSYVLVLYRQPGVHAIEKALSSEGFRVIVPGNWQQATEAVANHEVAVAVVDLELSQIWGQQVLEGLRRWSEKICIIVYAANRSYDSARMAVNLGAVAYIDSSDEPKELIIAVHRAMRTYLQRKAAAAARAAAELGLRLQMAIHAANLGLWDWDLSSNQVFYCSQWKRQLGHQEHEVSSSLDEWYDRVHPQDRDHLIGALQGFVRKRTGELRLEFRLRHTDGSYRWILMQAALVCDSEGNPIRMLGANVDITDRKLAQEGLEAALRFNEAIIRHAAEGICVYQDIPDPPGAVFSVWNDQMIRITGYSLDEINSIGLHQALFPEQQLRKLALEVRDQILQGKDLTDQQMVIVRKDGQHRTVRFSTSRIDGPDGRKHVLVLMRDITDVKAQQRRIIDYQRQLKALASELTVAEERLRREFATQLHDELSQVVAMAKLRLEGLIQSTDAPARAQLEQIAADLEQALGAVRSLTAKLSYPALGVLGLSKAIEKWLDEEIGQKHKLQTVFVDDQSPKPVDKDVQSVLFRSVREVLTNAVKHSKARRIVVAIQRWQSNIAVIIEDDGVGFDPAAVLPHCSGFGILSIQESLSRLGGSIEVESRPGAGCRVVLQAPLSLQADGQQATKPLG